MLVLPEAGIQNRGERCRVSQRLEYRTEVRDLVLQEAGIQNRGERCWCCQRLEYRTEVRDAGDARGWNTEQR